MRCSISKEEGAPARPRLDSREMSMATRRKRPTKRRECPDARPCPWVSCRDNLSIAITRKKFVNFTGSEDPKEWGQNCCLDHAEKGPVTLEDIGALMGVTRERIRQIEISASAHFVELAHLNLDVPMPEPRVVDPEGCPTCGTAFTPTHSQQVYCNARCRPSWRKRYGLHSPDELETLLVELREAGGSPLTFAQLTSVAITHGYESAEVAKCTRALLRKGRVHYDKQKRIVLGPKSAS
jgi:hypothetical protein